MGKIVQSDNIFAALKEIIELPENVIELTLLLSTKEFPVVSVVYHPTIKGEFFIRKGEIATERKTYTIVEPERHIDTSYYKWSKRKTNGNNSRQY